LNSLVKQLSASVIISLLCAVGFGLIAMQIDEDAIHSFDRTWIAIIQGMESPSLTSVMRVLDIIGAGKMAAALALLFALVLYIVFGHRRELIFFFGVLLCSWLLNESLKLMFQRARPTIHRIVEAVGYSFPSGHTMAAFTFYSIVVFLLWRHLRSRLGRALLLLFGAFMIVAIGISRIYLGVHYPSDVVGGYLASGSLIAMSIWYFRKFVDRRKRGQTAYSIYRS